MLAARPESNPDHDEAGELEMIRRLNAALNALERTLEPLALEQAGLDEAQVLKLFQARNRVAELITELAGDMPDFLFD